MLRDLIPVIRTHLFLESNQRPASTQVYFELPLAWMEKISDEDSKQKRLEIFWKIPRRNIFRYLWREKIESFEDWTQVLQITGFLIQGRLFFILSEAIGIKPSKRSLGLA